MNYRLTQGGQILPLGIALILFSAMMVIVVFNTGQAVSVKTRLANTADSAAYSGLLWQARALNFQSYANRAMVANQVAMAQAASLRSWSLYSQIAAENVNTLLGSVPYLGAITSAMQTTLQSAADIVDPVSEAMLSAANTINRVLSEAQSAMYVAGFKATPQIVKAIASADDSTFNTNSLFSIAHSGHNQRAWQNFTQAYKTDHDLAMTTRADLINRSLDVFSRRRDWDFFDRWFYIAPAVRLKLQKKGETRLINTDNQWEWKSKDTLSLNTRIWRPFRSDKKIELPVGWGQAYANQSRDDQSIGSPCSKQESNTQSTNREHCLRWFSENQQAENQSDENTSSLSGRASREKISSYYSGLQAYRDLANLGKQQKDPRLILRVEIQSLLSDTNNASKFGLGGVFNLPGNAARDSLAAVSSAEVYFRKPADSQVKEHIEYANLYNPFWDVRLIDTPLSVKQSNWILRDPALATSALDNYAGSKHYATGIRAESGAFATTPLLPGGHRGQFNEQ